MKTAGEILKQKNRENYFVSPKDRVIDAIKVMNDNRIGAILIKEDEDIVGIWTERDLLRNMGRSDFHPENDVIEYYMTKDIVFASADENIYSLMDKIIGLKLRHLPIKEDDKFIGMLSSGDILKTTLLEKDKELKELHSIASWEYYENWSWDKRG